MVFLYDDMLILLASLIWIVRTGAGLLPIQLLQRPMAVVVCRLCAAKSLMDINF